MPKYQDLTGRKFGELTALRIDWEKTKASHSTYWICKCSCGSEKSYIASNLTRNHTTSCGCKTNSMKHKTHGMSNTRIYKIWLGIKKRCYAPYTPHYDYYGGRGISMCAEWRGDFQKFYEWSVANGYTDSLTIDRIDVNGDYSPNNCRWATIEQQAHNKRNLLYAKVNGIEKSLCEWSETYHIPLNALRLRYLRGVAEGITEFDSNFLFPLREHPRRVMQYTLTGEFIKEWRSAKEASEAGFGGIRSIRECCSGKNRTHQGYIWRYAE